MKFEAVRVAVFQRLAGYAPLLAITQGVGSERPQDDDAGDASQFPFTIIDEVTAQPWDTKTSNGGNQLVQVTTYARPSATASATTLANNAAQAAYDALHKYDLPISGADVVNCLFDSTPGMFKDPDGKTRYKPLVFRVVYDEA